METKRKNGRPALWAFFALAMTCGPAFGGTAPAENGLTRVAEGVYSYVDATNPSPATSFGANAGIILGRDGVVVVDTLTSAKEARRFKPP